MPTFRGARHSSCVGSLLPPESLATDDWPLATDDWPLFRVRLPHSHPAPLADRRSLQIPWPLVPGHWPLFPRPASHAPRHCPLATNRPAKIGFVRLPNSALVRPKLRLAKD